MMAVPAVELRDDVVLPSLLVPGLGDNVVVTGAKLVESEDKMGADNKTVPEGNDVVGDKNDTTRGGRAGWSGLAIVGRRDLCICHQTASIRC